MWELRQLEESEDPGATEVIWLTRADGQVLTFKPAAKLFDDTLTIRFSQGEWAVWNIVHLGGPAHPMHIHMTEFQMLNHWQWPLGPGGALPALGDFTGATGSFMYHCHILDHEDHTMMRPFTVLPKSLMVFHDVHGGVHH